MKVSSAPRRSTSSSTKSVKPLHRGSSKRGSTSTHSSTPEHVSSHHSHSVVDGRHKRVWKACERCRMKKTKVRSAASTYLRGSGLIVSHLQCDGEFPCKRCKDDGLVCTAGTRKKTEYKQLPRGYVHSCLESRLHRSRSNR